MKTLIAVLLAATVAVPSVAQDAAPVKRMTIVIDNRNICFGGRIGEARQMRARFTAEAEAKRLRGEGYKVRVVTLDAGFDRTMPDDGVRTYTAIC